MLVLLGIGLLAGVVTALSPCVLPVLPILLAGGASGGRRRPYAIVAGLVASFSTFTLVAAWLLDRLGLPQDLLRDVAIALLFLLATTLVVPRLGELLERPLLVLTRRRGGDLGGGFLLGAGLGLVFTPCAGPVLAAITAQAARLRFGLDTVLLTVFYAAGAAVPMLAVAAGGRRALALALRRHAVGLRAALGVAMALGALGIVLHLDERAQTAVGDYTSALQGAERSAAATRQLNRLQGRREVPLVAARGAAGLPDYGPAPQFRGISAWLNTPGGRPLTLPGLRGKVVLVDFWTYSCINCLRTLPHLEAWDRAYRRDGLVIVGVHTPEFAFEHVPANVRAAVARLGVRYPVALDDGYDTWNAYANQYWPAEYLIDRAGHVRHVHFGEGEYARTESLIRRLLAEPGVRLPAAETRVPDTTPAGRITPESYLGYGRLERYAGSPVREDRMASYRFPTALARDELAYAGRWRVEWQRIVAGPGARLRLSFRARSVHLVLGGSGTARVLVDGRPLRTVRVSSIPRLYTLASFPRIAGGLLELRLTPGLSAYAFTFG